ncbi:MAG: DICT sensory domain-containing protein [Snowella sp.]|nr:DICT sensory domain-containing protein [Snowella sp.]
MNPHSPHSHELSLYQLVHEFSPNASPLVVSPRNFQGLIQGVIHCCRERKLPSTLWVKLPTDPTWVEEIDQYYQEGLTNQIYYCSISEQGKNASDRGRLNRGSLPERISQVVLEASAQLQHEFFFLILSPQLASVFVAQEIIPTDKEGSSAEKSLKLLVSFVPEVINRFLEELKGLVTITDSTPEELTADAVLSFPLPQRIQADLLTPLFQAQLSQLAALSTTDLPVLTKKSHLKPVQELFGSDEDFLLNMTRELSLPLTNMKTALRLLDSMQNKREQRQRYLDLLQRECDRQNLLISGLQEFIQLNHPLDEKDTSVRLEDAVPGIVSTYQPIAEEKGISLGYTIPAGFPAINCPSSWLRLILHHLLHNSLKFTKPPGRVYVQSTLKGQNIELTVSDGGVGIDSSDIPYIFGSFYRGRNAMTPELAGAGLGLATVKLLVERCGASITVNSHVGKGTIFRMLFPIAIT